MEPKYLILVNPTFLCTYLIYINPAIEWAKQHADSEMRGGTPLTADLMQ